MLRPVVLLDESLWLVPLPDMPRVVPDWPVVLPTVPLRLMPLPVPLLG